MDNTSDAEKPVSTAQQAAINAVNGFIGKNTVFHANGSITETYADGRVISTQFPNSNTIVVTQTLSGRTTTKTITFKTDGSISEVIS